MNTPLQKAAQAVIDRWETTFTPSLQRSLTELRKALDAELQQSVEPVAWLRTTESTKDTVWGAYGPHKVFETDVPLYLHPPQQVAVPSGERAELIAQLIRKADAWDYLHPTAKRPNVCRQAADMLEADAAFRPDWVNYRQGVKDGKADAQQANAPK